MTQKVTSNSITSVDVSKLSGNHTNATYGQNLTGINDGIIESASDPTASSNPAGGLGTLWVNYTSGEMYNLTNASTNSNYWTNVGGKSGDIFYSYTGADGQIGTQYGYCGYGEDYTQATERFSFASSANGSNFVTSNLMPGGYSRTSTTSSKTHGYAANWVGYNNSSGPYNEITKFSFSSGTNYRNVGTMGTATQAAGGCQSPTHGFVVGGTGGGNRKIQKYSFSTDAYESVWGTANNDIGLTAASNSDTHGYWIGGGWPNSDVIGRFSFATQNQSADVGTFGFAGRYWVNSWSSTTHGYFSGGNPFNISGVDNRYQRFAFASSVTLSTWGSLQNNTYNQYHATSNNTTHGYWMGGYHPWATSIGRFPWASASGSSSVGSLANSRYLMKGWQK